MGTFLMSFQGDIIKEFQHELESRRKNVFHNAACRDAPAGIMARREFSVASQNQTFPEASGRGRPFLRAGGDGVCLRCGLWCVPLPRRGEPPAVRTSHGHALLRGAAEKWQNPIHLQPTGVPNLCPRVVSPCRIRALLVFRAAYRTTDGYLKARSGVCRVVRRLPRICRVKVHATFFG
jgi:hypothetical protein